MLDIPSFDDPRATDAATYLAAALHALAREEQAGRRPRRLLEPGLATWQRFHGRLGPRDFAELLLEDAAVTQPEPFAASEILASEDPFRPVPDAVLETWLADLPGAPLAAPLREDLELQAQRLGIEGRPAFSDLHRLQPHHRVLELPGTGGRLAAHVADTQPDIALKDVFTIACGTWQERTLAGIVAVGLGVVGDVRIVVDPTLAECRKTPGAYSHVFGLKPEKGGRFSRRELEGWFPAARETIVLV